MYGVLNCLNIRMHLNINSYDIYAVWMIFDVVGVLDCCCAAMPDVLGVVVDFELVVLRRFVGVSSDEPAIILLIISL